MALPPVPVVSVQVPAPFPIRLHCTVGCLGSESSSPFRRGVHAHFLKQRLVINEFRNRTAEGRGRQNA